jgi:predicted MFS family arabinose efflux permease
LKNGIAQQIPRVTGSEALPDTSPPMDRRLVWVLAVACALSVANLYYIQPILVNMGQTFHVSVNQMGFIATLTQLGYATGLLLIVPLGDRYNRRTLIVDMLMVFMVAYFIGGSPGSYLGTLGWSFAG